MDTGDRAAHVTQRELYSALTMVWLFIMIALSTTVFSEPRTPIRSTANVIYLAASLLMVITYSIKSWRGDGSRPRVGVAVLAAVLALGVGLVAFLVGRTSA